MNKTKIEWTDYTWNPATGCERGCEYCYARKVHERFNPGIPFEKIQYHEQRQSEPRKIKKSSRIFVGSMSDICYWDIGYLEDIVQICRNNRHHTFIFLTKDCNVYNGIIFPENCWLGVSDTGDGKPTEKFFLLRDKKFVSFEPLLSDPEHTFDFYANHGIGWVIVGGLTPKNAHKKEWVDKIVEWTRAARIPLFLKNNLHYPEKIQEFPGCVKRG